MILKWDDATYLTGVEEVDIQHKELFKGVNDFLAACTTIEGTASQLAQEKTLETLEFLGKYVVEHFQTEEEYMERYRSPLQDVNVAEHKKFLQQFAKIKKRINDEGLSRQMVIRLEGFLCGWLSNHIMKVDSSLREVLPEKTPESDSLEETQEHGNFFSRLWAALFK